MKQDVLGKQLFVCGYAWFPDSLSVVRFTVERFISYGQFPSSSRKSVMPTMPSPSRSAGQTPGSIGLVAVYDE